MVLGLGVTSPIAVYFLGCCGASRAHRRTTIRALRRQRTSYLARHVIDRTHTSCPLGLLHFTAKRGKVFAVPSQDDRDNTDTARGQKAKTVPRARGVGDWARCELPGSSALRAREIRDETRGGYRRVGVAVAPGSDSDTQAWLRAHSKRTVRGSGRSGPKRSLRSIRSAFFSVPSSLALSSFPLQ